MSWSRQWKFGLQDKFKTSQLHRLLCHNQIKIFACDSLVSRLSVLCCCSSRINWLFIFLQLEQRDTMQVTEHEGLFSEDVHGLAWLKWLRLQGHCLTRKNVWVCHYQHSSPLQFSLAKYTWCFGCKQSFIMIAHACAAWPAACTSVNVFGCNNACNQHPNKTRAYTNISSN